MVSAKKFLISIINVLLSYAVLTNIGVLWSWQAGLVGIWAILGWVTVWVFIIYAVIIALGWLLIIVMAEIIGLLEIVDEIKDNQ